MRTLGDHGSVIILAITVAGMGWLYGCAGAPPKPPPKTRVATPRPAPSPWETPAPAPTPVPSPPPAAGKPPSAKPYKVMGKWYHPIPTASGFTQTGKASWYGEQFHGRPTANGERYDMHGTTAAHKTLPLGTVVRVDNLDNGRTLDIRINDRGPFVEGRIIDLSYGAAKTLGVVGPGTANVRITALGKPTSATAGTAAPTYEPEDYSKGNFTFQIGAFKDPGNAERLKQRLSGSYQNVHVKAYFNEAHGTLYGVRLGLATTLEQAAEYKQILRQKGFEGAFTIAE